MKKILLSFMALAICLLTATGQTRMTLHEEFTGENCGPCAGTNPGFWALCDGTTNPSKLIHISYMMPIPSPGWYCNRTLAINTRMGNYYSVPFAPYGRYDGHVPDPGCSGGSSAGHPGCFTQGDIDAEAAIPSHFNMTVTNVWNAAHDSVTATVSVTCVTAYSGTLYLRTVLVQTNDFMTSPGSNGETHFENVVQAMYPDTIGTPIAGSWTVGMNNVYTIKGAVPNWVDKSGGAYIVSWIQNDVDKSIDQAAKASPLPANLPVDAGTNVPTLTRLVCAGATFSATHSAVIKNWGTTPLTSATVYYKVDAGAYTSYAWTGTIAPGATGSAAIPAVTGTATVSGSYHTIIDSVAMPNGSADVNTPNNVNGNWFFVESNTARPMPYSTSFEDHTDSLYYFSNDANDGSVWNIWQTGTTGVYLGHTGTYAAGFPFFNYAVGAVNSFVLPEVTIADPAHTILSFWVSYSQTTTSNTDKLEVVYSTDCGSTWTSLWNKSGSTMVTLPASTTGYSYPTSPSQYNQYSVNLTGVTAGSALLGFRATDGGGNFIFVDDILIRSTTGVNSVAATSDNISIYPNPAKEEATLSFNLSDKSDVQVQIVDGLGRVMNMVANEKMDAGAHSFTINTSSLASGVYNIMIHTEGGTSTERLTVIK